MTDSQAKADKKKGKREREKMTLISPNFAILGRSYISLLDSLSPYLYFRIKDANTIMLILKSALDRLLNFFFIYYNSNH